MWNEPVTGCPTCATPLEQARSLVHPRIEAAFREPRGSWSCPGCLGIVVEEDDGEVRTRVPGSVMSRSIEHLRRARDDGSLMSEAIRLASDPATWFVARVPEVFALFAWRAGMKARLTDTCSVIVPETARLIATGPTSASDIRVDPWNGRAPGDAAMVRAFASMGRHERPESIEPGENWKQLSPLLSTRVVLDVIAVEAPMIVFDGSRIAVMTQGEVEMPRVLGYADTAVPAL